MDRFPLLENALHAYRTIRCHGLPSTAYALSRPFVVARQGQAAAPELRGQPSPSAFRWHPCRPSHAHRARDRACDERQGPSAVLTFEPHPRKYFVPNEPMFRLTPEPVKLTICASSDSTEFSCAASTEAAETTAAGFSRDFWAGTRGRWRPCGTRLPFRMGTEGTPAVLAICAGARDSPARSCHAVQLGRRIRVVERRCAPPWSEATCGWQPPPRYGGSSKRRCGTATSAAATVGFPTANFALGEDFKPGPRHLRPCGPPCRPASCAMGRQLRPPADLRQRRPAARGARLDFAGDLYGQTIQVSSRLDSARRTLRLPEPSSIVCGRTRKRRDGSWRRRARTRPTRLSAKVRRPERPSDARTALEHSSRRPHCGLLRMSRVIPCFIPVRDADTSPPCRTWV